MQFDIWDTAGQERFQSLGALYYKNSTGAIIVYDITSPASFQRAKSWVNELMENADPDIQISLVGNKSDLDSLRKVSIEDAEGYAQSTGQLYFECSAKTGNGVKDTFLNTSKHFCFLPDICCVIFEAG